MTPQCVAGKAYFITNQHPKPFWGMMGDVCGGLNYTRPHLKLPFLLIILIAFLFEYVIRPLLKPFKTINSDFTVNRCEAGTATVSATRDAKLDACDFLKFVLGRS
jgi:sterol-4alpha-carboxylate 3-dehydrogenase (decarboxylating)